MGAMNLGKELIAPVTEGCTSMSGISSVNNQSYNAVLLFAAAVPQSNSSSASCDSSAASTATSASNSNSTGSAGTAAASGSSFQDQLVTAIETALQNAEQSGNTSNLNSVVQNAVSQVFQANGITSPTDPGQAAAQAQPADATQQPQATHHHHHHHSGGTSQSSSTNASDATGSTSTDGASNPAGTTATSAADSSTSPASGPSATTQSIAPQQLQLGDLLSQLAGNSGNNQSISGFLFNIQA